MDPTIDVLTIAADPDRWVDAGFHLDADGTCRAGRVRLAIGAVPGVTRGIVAWSLHGLDAAGAVDGLLTMDSDRGPAEPADHPNGVRSIDHLVVATPDIVRTVEALAGIGLEPRRTREFGTPLSPRRQVFFRLGEVILEVVGPGRPEGAGPAVFWGVAFTVADLEATAGHLGDLLGGVKSAVQPGRRIATLRREAGLGTRVAFMSAPEPRPGQAPGEDR